MPPLSVKWSFVLFLASVATSLQGQSTASLLNVSTLDGAPGNHGFSDGSGQAARFDRPWGIAVCSTGTVIVADTNNQLIRRIDSSGNVTTLAGSPKVAGSADGVGSAAQFNLTQYGGEVACGAGETVFVADNRNHTVRKITPSGEVTTLAGRAAVAGNVEAPRAPPGHDPCASALQISNLRRTGNSTSSFDIAWDPPLAGGNSYRVTFLEDDNYCNSSSLFLGRFTLQEPKFSLPLNTPNKVYKIFVTATDDRCAPLRIAADTLSPPAPSKPIILSATAVGSSVVISHRYRDERSNDLVVERAGEEGNFVAVGSSTSCSTNPVDPRPSADFVDFGPGGSFSSGGKLAPGTYQYRLRAANFSGTSLSEAVTVTVGGNPASPPEIVSFFLVKVSGGGHPQRDHLFYETRNAVRATIGGVALDSPSGDITLEPTTQLPFTVYKLTAYGADGSRVTKQLQVVDPFIVVIIAGFEYRLELRVIRSPQPIVQSANFAGGTASVTFFGETFSVKRDPPPPPLNVSFEAVGEFFTIDRATAIVGRGETVSVNIQTRSRPPGFYEGAVEATIAGRYESKLIPVRLLVSLAPQGTTVPDPQANRVDAIQSSGTVQITNNGTAPLEGLLASDAPWLIPQEGIIRIAPGQTVPVTFRIDSTQRPDGERPIGSVTALLSLGYLDGAAPSQGRSSIESLGDDPEAASRKVLVVHLAAAANTMTALPKLLSGEIALFLPGIAKRSDLVTDVTLINPSISSFPDLKLIFAESGKPTTIVQQATFGSLFPSSRVLFSDILKGVFDRPEGVVGGLQIRGSNTAQVSLAGTVTNPTNPNGLYSGTLASQRSDRSLASGEATVLPGVRKDGSSRTHINIQEVTGEGGFVRTDFFAEDGTLQKSRTDSIEPFGLLELADDAPAGSASARVTNLGPASRVVAEGLVFDAATSDPMNLVDWNRRKGTSASEPQVILLASSRGAQGRRTHSDVWITNSGNETAMGTLVFRGVRTRRRLAARSTGQNALSPIIDSLGAARTISLVPGATQVVRDAVSSLGNGPQSGYLVYTPTSGTVGITSGTFLSTENAVLGNPGTSVPVLAASFGLKKDESRQFSNLEDAEAKSIAKRDRATYQTDFALIETMGKPAKVTATLTYVLKVEGGVVVNPIESSKEFSLGPNEMIVVNEVARSIFGPGRENLGNLHDLRLRVVVDSGEGRVIPYVLSTENGSGDMVLRIE